MKYLFFIVCSITSFSATADIKTDKFAGNCAAYMSTKGSEAGAREALNMADNQKRALAFANKWLDSIKSHKNDKSYLQGAIYAAAADCREVGIKSSDY